MTVVLFRDDFMASPFLHWILHTTLELWVLKLFYLELFTIHKTCLSISFSLWAILEKSVVLRRSIFFVKTEKLFEPLTE